MVPTVDFFFYGTLMDDDVRAAVFGMAAAPRAIEPATVAGLRRVPVLGANYPMVVHDPAAAVEGLLVAGADLNAAARTSYFEKADDFLPVSTDVPASGCGVARAWVFMPGRRIKAAPGEWRFDEWRRRHHAAYLRQCRVWMRRCRGREQARLREEWRFRLDAPP